ncbi:hypothetical protein Hanom_Chr04g00321011 [Helianthus anomalus]
MFVHLIKAKLHFSSFMFQGFFRRCPLSLKITLYVLYVCNLLQAVSFLINPVNF